MEYGVTAAHFPLEEVVKVRILVFQQCALRKFFHDLVVIELLSVCGYLLGMRLNCSDWSIV